MLHLNKTCNSNKNFVKNMIWPDSMTEIARVIQQLRDISP